MSFASSLSPLSFPPFSRLYTSSDRPANSRSLHYNRKKLRMPSAAHPKYVDMIDMAVHTGHG